jgi:hypothetical protein
MVAEQHIAFHARSANSYSIGIEHEGGCYNDPGCFSDKLYEASANLVHDICLRNNIDVDSTHIIGHDQVPGTTHGDPGGYWDWDYYFALINWNGRDPRLRPIRIVLDYQSLDVWPTTEHWHERARKQMNWGPDHRHSYGPRYFWATPDRNATVGDAVVYYASIPRDGTYTLSAWWPVSSNNNPNTTITVSTTSADPTQRSHTTLVSQNERRIITRSTEALPSTHTWYYLNVFRLRAGDEVSVEVSRRSDSRGTIVADAFRLLKT